MSNITVKGDGRILLNGIQHGPKYAYETACTQARLLATTALAAGATIEYETRIPTKADIEAETLRNKQAAKDKKKADREKVKADAKEAVAGHHAAIKKAKADDKEKARLAALPVLPPPPVNLPDTCPIAC